MYPSEPDNPWFARLAWSYRAARRVAIAVVGGSLVAVGIGMLVLPGPAFVVIPAGLAVLGAEFAWARRWLKRLRAEAERGVGAIRGIRGPTQPR